MDNAGESFVAGVDKLTGRNRWKIERPRDINWVTPLVLDRGGRAEVLVQGSRELSAHDVRTGEKRWRAKGSRSARRSALVASRAPRAR